MNEKPIDDIFALCARFNLDQDSYRVFPKKPAHVLTSKLEIHSKLEAAKPEGAPQFAEPVEDANAPAQGSLKQPEPIAPAAEQSAKEKAIDGSPEELDSPEAGRIALRNLWRHIGHMQPQRARRGTRQLLKESVCAFGTAGGTGVTTVAVTLARLLSKFDRSCAIVDGHRRSLLPFFFEGQALFYGHERFRSSQQGSGSAVRIITPDARTFEDENTADSWLEGILSDMRNPIDDLIFDMRTSADFPAIDRSLLGGAALIVAIPDVSSVVGARALKNQLADESPDLKQICVLNKYDASLTLHGEIRAWFESTFEHTLTLSRCDLVDEALAEGLTVIDWAPQSNLAQNYSQLLDLTQRFATPTQSN